MRYSASGRAFARIVFPTRLGPQSQATLGFFLAPTCPVCKKLIPVLKALVKDEGRGLRVVLASDGAAPEHLAFVQQNVCRFAVR